MTLDQWLKEHGRTNRWLAERAPANEVTVTRWRRHYVLPRPDMVRRIEKITAGGVTPADWYEPVPDAPRGRLKTIKVEDEKPVKAGKGAGSKPPRRRRTQMAASP